LSLDFLYNASEWLIALVFLAMLLLAGEAGFRLGDRIESSGEETTKMNSGRRLSLQGPSIHMR